MPRHIICLAGRAGSGKTSTTEIIHSLRPNVEIFSLADTFKEFLGRVFDWSPEILWGPSERRDVPDRRYDTKEAWEEARDRRYRLQEDFVASLLPEAHLGRSRALDDLATWFCVERDLSVYGDGNDVDDTSPRPLTPRRVCKSIANDWGRAGDEELWVKDTWRRVCKVGYSTLAVVGDVRRINEADFFVRNAVTASPVHLWRLTNPRIPKIDDVSENEVDCEEMDELIRHEICNDGSLGDLERKVSKLLCQL